MKSFIDFSENLDDKKKQLMQKQRVMQQLEKERASRTNQEFQQKKEENKKREQLKQEIKNEIKQELEDEEMDEEFGKMTKKQTQAYTGMDDKEQKALYKKMKKDGNFDVKKNLAGAASDDKDLGEELNKDDKPFIKKLVGKLRGGSKTHAKQADDLEKAMKEETTKADLYKAYSKGMKMMSGTKEFKAHQEKISKMRKALKMNEGKKWDSYKKAVATVLGKKKEQRTAQKAMDAGARLRRKKQRQEYASKVSGSEDLVPDDIRD